MKNPITMAFGLLLSLASTAANLPVVPPLSGLTVANAVVYDNSRYATPAGCCSSGGINPPPTGPGEARLDPWDFGNGSGSAISSLGDAFAAPHASAQASLSPGPRNPAGQGVAANAYAFYAFEISGNAGLTGQLTKIRVTDNGTTTGTGDNGYASTQMIVDDFSVGSADPNRRIYTRQASTSCTFGVCTVEANFSDASAPIFVPINHVMAVYLTVSANTNVPLGSSQAPGTFLALIDPTFTLDPLAPSGLTLIFSSGVQQPVPEPSKLALFLIGFGALGLMACARKA